MNQENQKEWVTIDDAATHLGVKRATVYNYMHDLNELGYPINTRKFRRDRRAYLSRDQVNLIQDYKEHPWKYEMNDDKGKFQSEGNGDDLPLVA